MFCQVTKEKLVYLKDSYLCKSLGIIYPIKKNITFMGYKQEEKESIVEILLNSQTHQGTLYTLKNDFEFAKYSYPLIAESISTFKKLYSSIKGGIAVNVGSGGDPSSNEIAALGFDTYACEIEPNSLFMSSFWDNKNCTKVKRIVCDCFSLPFPDSSVSLLYCKEFLHHMEDYDGVLNEFSRVLKTNGITIIIEPTLTARTTKGALDFPGHHYQYNSKYISSFTNNGFKIDEYYLYYILRHKRLKHKISSLPYGFFNNQFKKAKHSMPQLNEVIQKIMDGQNIWFLKKIQNVNPYETNKIKNIGIIDINFLTVDESIFNNEYFEKGAQFYSGLRKEYELD